MTEPIDWARIPRTVLQSPRGARNVKIWTDMNRREGRFLTYSHNGDDLLLEAWQGDAPKGRMELSSEFPDFATQLLRSQRRLDPVRRVSIAQALSVPAIQRAVTLISHTVGSLSMQGWMNGSPMGTTPIVLARPNPWETPYDFQRDEAFNLATAGEFIGWIASRDSLGYPTALVNVPPIELQVNANQSNRLLPEYRWGERRNRPAVVVGTRYSLANPSGQFVHVMYHRDPAAQGLRGIGPLQMCGAAVSIAVESQRWASNLFVGGGVPPLVIKTAVELGSDPDPDTGLTEAQQLKEDWMAGDNNTPKVIDPLVDTVTQMDFNPNAASMLDSRNFSNGDAARMFGIPGTLLEYNMPGASLTYQNIADVWTEFVRGCLAPSYLEPLEAHMSDLLPRSQAGRFNIEGLLRADIKTRYEVYQIGIASGVLTVPLAQQAEAIIPGNIEVAPVPPSPPSAVPSSVFAMSREVRCDGEVLIRGRLQPCNKLLNVGAPFIGKCSRCKKDHAPLAVAS